MKRIIFLLLFLLSLSTYAQKETTKLSRKEIEQRYQDSIAEINDITKKIAESEAKTERLEEKVLNFYVRVISKAAEDKYASDASYNKDGTKFNLTNYDAAKEFLHHFVDTQKDTNHSKCKAYRTLAWIAINEKKYTEAKQFIDDSERIQYLYYCGNEPESEKKKVKKMYDICEKGVLSTTEKN